MNRNDILLSLLTQAVEEGAEPLTLRAIVEEASEAGAQRALAHLGLSDTCAHKDISDLRQLLTSWRDVQQTARRAVVRWLMTVLLGALALGVLVYADIPPIKP